jgi:hypothetical protein
MMIAGEPLTGRALAKMEKILEGPRIPFLPVGSDWANPASF